MSRFATSNGGAATPDRGGSRNLPLVFTERCRRRPRQTGLAPFATELRRLSV